MQVDGLVKAMGEVEVGPTGWSYLPLVVYYGTTDWGVIVFSKSTMIIFLLLAIKATDVLTDLTKPVILSPCFPADKPPFLP